MIVADLRRGTVSRTVQSTELWSRIITGSNPGPDPSSTLCRARLPTTPPTPVTVDG